MRFQALACGLLMLSIVVDAKTRKVRDSPKQPEDQIEVVGHIPLTNVPVSRFMTTQHYSSNYLYVESSNGKSVMLVDVTKMAQPKVLGDVTMPASGGSENLYAVAGTAAVVTGDVAATANPARTIRIMNFSDPQHPKVTREFTGVTATSRDERRGLIFVANGEGIWILRQTFADDPEVEKAYARQVIYQ